MTEVEYRQGNIGRIFVIKIEHGDDPLHEISKIAANEKVKCAVFTLIGAVGRAKIVVGPQDDVVPPNPVWKSLHQASEVVGIGTLFPDEDGAPSIHLHSSLGRGGDVLTGCIRGETEAFIVLEAVLLEIDGVAGIRSMDSLTGLHLLNFGETHHFLD